MSEIKNSNLLGKITILVMVVLYVNTALALDGSGTEQDPWRIKSLDDFNDFAADTNYWHDYTRLETDVNLAGLTYSTAVIGPDTDNSNDRFDGIAYIGVFDGNNHKIINLTINDGGVGNDYMGLFGLADGIFGGGIKNLGLEGGYVRGRDYVGGLVGFFKYGNVSNCYSTCSVSGDGYVGGLLGRNWAGSISNCYSVGNVSGTGETGGLVGENYDGDVLNCYSTGDVSGTVEVGGLLGRNWYGAVSNCYSTGGVSGTKWCVGGLVGYFKYGNVSNCYSSGSVSGTEWCVGGLVGDNFLGSILNCYSIADVNGVQCVGGLVGVNSGSVSNCYSTGDVNGIEDVGGLVGINNSECDILNSFWDTDTQTHGITESIGFNDEGIVTNVEGLSTAQLHQQSAFTNWDFLNTWDIGEIQTYPHLRVYLPSDINKDGIVNFLDLSITANQWMEGE